MPSFIFAATLATMVLATATPSTSIALEFPEPQHIDCGQHGWFYRDNNCYLMDPRHTDPMSWHEAVTFCPTASAKFPEAYLSEIYSADEQAFVFKAVQFWVVEGLGSQFWLGGHDQVVEGQWEWAYSRAPLNFTAWLPGRPDGGMAYNCLFFSAQDNADYNTWADWDCDYADSMLPLCRAPYKP